MAAAKVRAIAAALAAAVWLCGCEGRRDAQAVASDLAATAEEMARIVAAARTLDDLKAKEGRLTALGRRAQALDKEAKRAGKAPEDVRRECGPRLEAALRKIAETRAVWMRAGKTDMVEFVDNLGPK